MRTMSSSDAPGRKARITLAPAAAMAVILIVGTLCSVAQAAGSAGPAMPAPAEQAASKAACAPFLKAGTHPQGKNQWAAPPKMVLRPAQQYQLKLYTGPGGS